MTSTGGPSDGAPSCRCHGLPMDRDGHGRRFCAEKRRARQRAAYHADPAGANYVRVRQELRARIQRKRQQLADLEARLEEENASGNATE